eukprot:11671313-Alexandrium_andersonii.AAC.1
MCGVSSTEADLRSPIGLLPRGSLSNGSVEERGSAGRPLSHTFLKGGSPIFPPLRSWLKVSAGRLLPGPRREPLSSLA